MTVDTVNRSIDDQGRLVTTRFWALKGEPPKVSWFFKSMPRLYNLERSVVDRDKRVFSLQSYNLSLFQFLDVSELCVYTPHPEDPSKTLVEQQYRITVKFHGLGSLIEPWAIGTCLENAKKGAAIIQQMCETMYEEMQQIATEADQSVSELGQILSDTVEKVADEVSSTVVPHISLDEIENTKDSSFSSSIPKSSPKL